MERSLGVPRTNSGSIDGLQFDPGLQSVKMEGDLCHWSGMHIDASESISMMLKGDLFGLRSCFTLDLTLSFDFHITVAFLVE